MFTLYEHIYCKYITNIEITKYSFILYDYRELQLKTAKSWWALPENKNKPSNSWYWTV